MLFAVSANNSPEAWNNHIALLCSLHKIENVSISCLEPLGKAFIGNKIFLYTVAPKKGKGKNLFSACVLKVGIPFLIQTIDSMQVGLWQGNK